MDESDLERVHRVARLARLALTDDRARELGPQFARILEHFRSLAEIEVEGLEPLAAPVLPRDVLRPDEPAPSLDREVLLGGAPEAQEGHYAVPKTVGGEG